MYQLITNVTSCTLVDRDRHHSTRLQCGMEVPMDQAVFWPPKLGGDRALFLVFVLQC